MGNSTAYSVPFSGESSIPARGSHASDYADLKQRVREAGLMNRTPVFYGYIFLEALVLLGISVTVLLTVSNIWIQMLNAAFLSFSMVRVGFIMHDTGHRQVFRKAGPNDIVGLFYANLLLGSSLTSWRKRHNDHHAFTNEIGEDPTLEIPVWAWIEEQARTQPKPIIRWLMQNQAFTFFPILAFSALFQAALAIRDVFFRKETEDRLIQGIFLILHWAWYLAVLFLAPMPWWGKLLFFIVQHIVMGLHLGLVFAPNHKGMPVLEEGRQHDFLYVQCLTTRNVKPSPLVDYLYGGLNYQIEHHLFPGMPRINLGKVHRIVKDFCIERGLPYYETGVIDSYVEILKYMHAVGQSARQPDPKPRLAGD